MLNWEKIIFIYIPFWENINGLSFFPKGVFK